MLAPEFDGGVEFTDLESRDDSDVMDGEKSDWASDLEDECEKVPDRFRRRVAGVDGLAGWSSFTGFEEFSAPVGSTLSAVGSANGGDWDSGVGSRFGRSDSGAESLRVFDIFASVTRRSCRPLSVSLSLAVEVGPCRCESRAVSAVAFDSGIVSARTIGTDSTVGAGAEVST